MYIEVLLNMKVYLFSLVIYHVVRIQYLYQWKMFLPVMILPPNNSAWDIGRICRKFMEMHLCEK